MRPLAPGPGHAVTSPTWPGSLRVALSLAEITASVPQGVFTSQSRALSTSGNFPMISDDLVNSYHLLLCVLDLVYGNALQCSNRRELINPGFPGLPEDFTSKDYKPLPEPPCIIETLCGLHDGLILEAKGIKEHFWKPYIRKLFDKKVLKGKEEYLTGFLDSCNFAESVKAVNKAYEGYVLSVGSLDERVFLEDADEEVGSLSRCLNRASAMESAERVAVTYNLQQNFDKLKSLRISTPLTGLKYIKESSGYSTPVSSATHSVSRLFSILTGHKPAPSERLLQILRACARNPTLAISRRLKEMYDRYCQHTQPEEEESNYCRDIATKYFRLAEVLYYKVLESIIEGEKKRLGDTDLSGILEQDVFHRSLLSCCLEITTFSYKPPGNFPHVIDMFEVAPYHFYKVIEVFIRAEDGLGREVVKHLNHIEEQILESMAWKRDSPLWDRIKENDGKVPTCEEVMPPQYFQRSGSNSASGSPTPLTPRRVSEIRADASVVGRSVPSSPATLYDRYSSPAAGSARRRLFMDTDAQSNAGSPGQATPQPTVNTVPAETMAVPPAPGQTLVNVSGQTHAVTSSMQPLTAQALAGPLTPQQLQVAGHVPAPPAKAPAGQQQRQSQTTGGSKLKKAGSLSLFFRKVYYLASVRLRDLCMKLDITDELRNKIWTCLEFSVVQCPDLMKARHLDQLLMCAVYVMTKVTKDDQSFQNIMRCYRSQPQARSHVYRSVLIKGRRRRHSGASDLNVKPGSPPEGSRDLSSREPSPVMRSSSTLPVPQPSSTPPTPTPLLGAGSDVEEEERGDLVQFYNSIYTEQIKSFAMKYSQANTNDAPPLSPYPFMRVLSPRRVQLSQNYPIYISPHKSEAALSPHEKIFYCFSSSPAKRLREINSMIRTGETPTKKRGILLEDGSESPAKRMCQESHTALLRRLQDVANDRGTH
ncbi:hypothetical protein FKM82_019041 [Ascaphus truei]